MNRACGWMVLGCLGCAPPPPVLSAWSLPSGPGSSPAVMVDTEGVRLTWFAAVGDGHELRTAMRLVEGWEASVIAADEPLFVNWADTPSVERGGDGALYVHYPRKSGAGAYAYDVVLARSEDGRTWQPLGVAHDDGTETEHGFGSWAPTARGARLAYLDGRETLTGGPMTLRSLEVTADGPGPAVTLDERVCDCCSTDSLSSDGGALVVYRDRSMTEIRDIAAASLSGRAARVSTDHWQIAGCPVNGPRVTRVGDHIVAAWTTGAPGSSEVRVSWSKDEGASFSPAFVVAPAGSGAEGRVELVTLTVHEAAVLWLDDSGVVAARVRPGAAPRIGQPMPIGSSSTERASGVPRAVQHRGEIIAVWTLAGHLAGARVPTAALPPALQPMTPAGSVAAAAPTSAGRRPALEATALDGSPASLPVEARPLLVSLWATWCGPCRRELPILAQISQRGDLNVVGVAVDDKAEVVGRMLAEHQARYPVLMAGRAQVLAAFGTAEVPALRLYDATGALVWSHQGPISASDLAAAVELSGGESLGSP